MAAKYNLAVTLAARKLEKENNPELDTNIVEGFFGIAQEPVAA